MTSFCPIRAEILTDVFRSFPDTDPVAAIALLLDGKIRVTEALMRKAYASEQPRGRMRHVRERLIVAHGDAAESAFVSQGYLVKMSPEECLATVAKAYSADCSGDRFLEILDLWNRSWNSVDRVPAGRQKLTQLSELVQTNEMVETIQFFSLPDEYQFPLGLIDIERELRLRHLPLRSILGLCFEESIAETRRTCPQLLQDLQIEVTALTHVIQDEMSSSEMTDTLAVLPDLASDVLPDWHVLLKYDHPAGGDAGAMHVLLAGGYCFRDYLTTQSPQSLEGLVMGTATNWHAALDDERMLEIARMHLGFYPDVGRSFKLRIN